MPGRRVLPVTPTQAYRQGLRSIREAVGNDFVLGCGAPLLPSVGYVNGMRVGEDTAPFWDSSLSPFHGPNAYHALKNPLMRHFMHRKLWLNDPDCILLRDSDIRLGKGERELYARVAGALDAMIVQSDNLALVDDEGFRLLKNALALRGGQASATHRRVLDLFEITTRGGPAGNLRLLANLSDQRMDWGEQTVEPRSVVEIPVGAGC
jgi:alpha-galactosidase